jgi:Tfp pilus assembly protein PilO
MYLSADSLSWPDSVALIGVILFVMFVIGIATSTWLETRKTRVRADQDDSMRQLVSRYEKLAETTLDAQQRVATDLSDLRSRAASIEQILRTVD